MPWGLPLMPSWLTWHERPASAAKQSWTPAMPSPSNHSFTHCLCASQARCSQAWGHVLAPPGFACSPNLHFFSVKPTTCQPLYFPDLLLKIFHCSAAVHACMCPFIRCHNHIHEHSLSHAHQPYTPPYHSLACAIIANLPSVLHYSPNTDSLNHSFLPSLILTTLTSAMHYAFTCSPIRQTHLLCCMGQAHEGEAHQVGGVCRVAGLPEEGAGPGGAAPAAPGDCPGPVGHVPGLRGQALAGPAGQV